MAWICPLLAQLHTTTAQFRGLQERIFDSYSISLSKLHHVHSHSPITTVFPWENGKHKLPLSNQTSDVHITTDM